MVGFSYSGDANNAAATLATPISQLIAAVLTVAPQGGTGAITVASRHSATAQINLTGAAGYSGSVTLTCSGLPLTAACAFSPATLNISGATAQSSTLTVMTNSGGATAAMEPLLEHKLTTLACGMFAGGLILLRPRCNRTDWMILMMVGLTLLGCGGNSSKTSTSANTSPGAYPFAVIATAGSTQITTNHVLTVQ